MDPIELVVGLVAGLALGVVVAAVVTRRVRATVAAERERTLRDLSQQLAVDREATTRATVDTVLAVAGDKFGAHTERAEQHLDRRGEAFEQQVAGLRHELVRVEGLVADLQRDKAQQHGQLVAGLEQAARASAALTDTTQALREALSNSRARGQWGERMADDVLRVAGFVEGVNYVKQLTLPGGRRPDITFLLPHQRQLHMDVKFPVDNYLRALDAPTDEARASATSAFTRDVRARIAEVGDRDYTDPERTLGYVLLFIPNESVYGFLHEHDPHLVDHALRRSVVLCSPCTLFAVLAVVRQAVDSFVLSRASDEILECLDGFSKQWQAFSDKLDRLGQQFTTAQRSYDELAGPRRRQLQKELDRVERVRSTTGLGSLDEPVEVGGDTTDTDAVDLVDRSVVAVADDALGAHPPSASPDNSPWHHPDESVA